MTLKHEFPVSFDCPKCGEKIEKTLGDLQREPVVSCACGATIEVSGADEPASALDELDRALSDVGAKRR